MAIRECSKIQGGEGRVGLKFLWVYLFTKFGL